MNTRSDTATKVRLSLVMRRFLVVFLPLAALVIALTIWLTRVDADSTKAIVAAIVLAALAGVCWAVSVASVRRNIAEQSLRSSEERHRLIIETANDAFISIDADGVVTAWNPQAEATFGWSEHDAMGRLLTDTIVPPQHKEAHLRGLEHFLSTGQGPVLGRRIEMTALRKNGAEFPLELTISAVPQGETYSFHAFLHDITERKLAEEALQRSEQWLSTTLSSIGDAVIATNPRGNLVFMNPVAEALTGYKEAEALGKPLEEVFNIINEQTGEKAETPLSRVMREGVVVGLANHTALIARDGAVLPIMDSGAPITGVAGEVLGVVLVFRDVTESRRAEEAIRLRTRELETLANIASILARPGEFQSKTSSVMEEIVAAIQAHSALMRVADEDAQGLRLIATAGLGDAEALARSIVPYGEGLSSEAFQRGEPITANDYASRPNAMPRTLERGIRSMTSLPVKAGGQTMGVVVVESLERDFFTPERVRFLAAVVDGMDVFVERARAEEALALRTQELEAFSTIGAIFAEAGPFEARAVRALEVMGNAVQSDRVALRFIDRVNRVARLTASWGRTTQETPQELSIPFGEGIVGRVAESGEMAAIDDYAAHPHSIPRLVASGIRSGVVVPVRVEGRLVASVSFTAQQRGHFTPERVHLAEALAGNIGAFLERARTEEELRLTQFSVDHAGEAIYWIGPDARFHSVNDGATHALGYSREELLSMTVHDVDPDVTVEAWAKLWANLKERGAVTLELRHRAKDGRIFPVEITANYLKFGDQEYSCAFARDITERKQAEEALQETNRRLEGALEELRQAQQVLMQRERLSALGQMAAGIAHDIGNALSPIVGFTDLLLDREEGLSDHVKQYLRYINTGGADIATIVGRMREFYRPRGQQDVLSSTSLNQVVQQVVDLTRPRWRDMPNERGVVIEVQTNLQQDLPPVMGIESEIREAITNLIFNAVDAMPSGGTLTLTTHVRAPEEDSGTGGEPARLILEVADTGIGMDEETLQRCLEPFFSTKGAVGTGLGLSMVFGVMQRHQGTIEIESEEGKGTAMRLVFPLEEATESVEAASAASTLSVPIKILCIDDEPLIRTLAREMLESDGHSVEIAEGGQEGLAAFHLARERGEPFDVVITDLGMPAVDGREVARRVKQESPGTPVIMLTAWADRAAAESGRAENVDYLLSKPPTMDELRRALVRVMQTAH